MALRAGFHGTVGQPSAQVIDGSLEFNDDNKQFLKKLLVLEIAEHGLGVHG